MSNPPRFRIIIQPKALVDLERIHGHISGDSAINASSVVGQLVNAVESLATLPNRFKVHERRVNPSKSVHSMPVARYLIYYRVDDVHLTVIILAIRHGARRQPKRFR
jgi:plasmid stabilization system protein ParE